MYIQAVERCRCEFIQLVWFEYTVDSELGNCPSLFGQSQSIRLPKSQPPDGGDYFDPQDHRGSLVDQTAVSILACRSTSGM